MSRIPPVLALAMLTALGCGSSSATQSPTEPTASNEASEKAHEHHPDLSPPLAAFHDVLAPAWHSEPGKVRATKACESAMDLSTKAADVGDADLTQACTDLVVECELEGSTAPEAKLEKVHERFHALMEH